MDILNSAKDPNISPTSFPDSISFIIVVVAAEYAVD
jgi:hypothetical protein